MLYRLARPFVFLLDPEAAHGLSIRALRAGLSGGRGPHAGARLRQTLFGLDFPNPIGLAAGYDKNAEAVDAALRLGFGFVECGTLTPRPQAGNPRPRLFRLTPDRAVINRMGFNNDGHEAAAARLGARAGRGGIVGVNIGANKDAVDRAGDYVAGYERLAALASYVTINISSPNTPGLRGLQNPAELAELLGRVTEARAASGVPRPILLKIAPDLDDDAIHAIVGACVAFGIDGLIVSNSTIDRPASLTSPLRGEAGGLSGRPLLKPSTRALAVAWRAAEGRLPLVGAGGVASAEDAYAKIAAGARLVQLYSAMVYEGPGLAARVARGLERLLEKEGLDVASLCGRDAAKWAA